MFSEVDMWMYKYIAGIRIDAGGGSVRIEPCYIPEIDWVTASHRGISVHYDKEKIEITSDIPAVYVAQNGKEIQTRYGEKMFY